MFTKTNTEKRYITAPAKRYIAPDAMHNILSNLSSIHKQVPNYSQAHRHLISIEGIIILPRTLISYSNTPLSQAAQIFLPSQLTANPAVRRP